MSRAKLDDLFAQLQSRIWWRRVRAVNVLASLDYAGFMDDRTTPYRANPRLFKEQAVSAIFPCLKDPRPRVRTAAYRALGDLGEPNLLEAIIPAVASTSPGERIAAAVAYMKIRARAHTSAPRTNYPGSPEFSRKQIAHGHDVRNARLARLNLTRAKLKERSLSGSDLTLASLVSADCYGADFSNAWMICADATRAKLSLSSMKSAHLMGATLAKANLDGADLSGADLRWASLIGASFVGTDLRDADLRSADLTLANISRVRTSAKTNLQHAYVDEKYKGTFKEFAGIPCWRKNYTWGPY